MTKDEALKLALNVLVNRVDSDHEAITAIREALAQSEGCQCPACKIAPHESDCPVHNEPAWPNGPCDCGAQPEQEPVAWITKNGKGWLRWHRPEDSEKNKDSIPLYTSPPASKSWQGLTGEGIDKLADMHRKE